MAAPPESLSGCKTCQGIWRRFTDLTFKDAVNFGPPAAALSTPCASHRPLVESFVKVFRSENRDIYRVTADMGIRRPGKEASPRLVESYSGGVFWDLLLARPEGKPDHPGTTRVLDPDWADLDMLKRWKDECLSSHGVKCENPINVSPLRPAWLVDLERKCLVPGSYAAEAAPYVTLSYTYGKYVAPGIDAETLVELQRANALGLPEITSKYVPPMVKHAMGLTSVLGERYLWVDLLCVPDGDPTLAKEEHLMQMGAVYANAVVTIIAADGDVEKGLPGLRNISGPRELCQRVIPFGEENKLVVRRPQVYRFDGHSSTDLPYYRRARTFQERLLSPRKVYFHEKELHWECACHVLHEEQVQPAAETIEESTDYPDISTMLAGFPDLGALDAVVDRYNARDLRYDEDALPAISGLLTVLSCAFPGGFLYGIPEMFFERGLGWRHGPSLMTQVRRRSPSGRPNEEGQSPSMSMSDLPSWSWIGWQGRMTMGRDGEAARINHRSHEIEETVPITKWYAARSSDTDPSQRRAIKSTWFEDREKYKDFSEPLPPGWSRHEAPEFDHFGRPRLYPDGCAEYVFRHEAGHSESWYYPFPMPEAGTPGTMPEQTPYLFCETTRVWLWGCQADRMNQVKLYDSSGGEVGELYLPNRSDLGAFPRRGIDDGCRNEREEMGLRVELVAICKSRVYEYSLDQDKRAIGPQSRGPSGILCSG
ncbi:hypothetical protein PG997_002211 [Apiospora hydei]|uniref:Heterokaryon incompatibility domain-containing protein n=1 Tax=Apiospora hydei TaxID=1337664 RepID=A0ABR1X8Z4_9PEZI